ncbi:MAG TPA: UbiA family prenyltransferase, partial [Candidatus Limnocylindrales bacterium]
MLVTHPFPSVLDGLITAAIALIAGAEWGIAVRLGLSMIALQASIGALNDAVDAPSDAVGRPSKPIPAGLVPRGFARALAAALAALGLALAARSGPAVLVLGAVILAIGYAYDLVFKATRWSWLPFAVGIPLLPVFAWLGPADRLPAAFTILVPAAVAAGAGLALGNSLVDLDGDAAAGLSTPAQSWGAAHVRLASIALLVSVAVVAVAAGLAAAMPTPIVVA